MRPRTTPPNGRFSSLLALLSVLVSFAATPAASAPLPEPFCGPCGGSFTEEAQRYGETNGVENVTFGIEHSTATIRVHDNGTATWTVKNRLASEETARYFRENGWMLDEIAENVGPGSSSNPKRSSTPASSGPKRSSSAIGRPPPRRHPAVSSDSTGFDTRGRGLFPDSVPTG